MFHHPLRKAGLGAAILLAFSLSAAAQTVAVDRLTIGSAASSVVLKDVTIENSSLGADAVRSLGAAGDYRAVADALRRLDASVLRIGSIETNERVGKERSTTVLENVEFRNVKAGRAAMAVVAKGRFVQFLDGDPVSTGAFGRMNVKDADIAFGFALQGPSDAPGRELRLVYGAIEITAIEMEPADGAKITVDRVDVADVRARPMPKGWLAAAEDFAAGEDFENLSPQRRAALVKDLDLFFSSFAVGSMEASGIRITDADETAVIGRIGFTGARLGRGPTFVIENFSQVDGDQKSRIGSIRFSDWSIEPLLKALVEVYGDAAAPKDVPWTRLLPAFGAMQIRDFSVAGLAAGGANAAAFKAFDLRIDNPGGGVPKGLRIATEGLAVTVDRDDPNAAPLLALGYDKLEVSSGLELVMRDGGDLEIKELSFSAPGLADLRLSGVLGNAGPVLAAKSGDAAFMSLFGLTAKRFDLVVTDRGLGTRAAAMEAKGSSKTADQVRREAGGMAAIAMSSTLGSSPGAKALTAAAVKFVQAPGRLTVSARAKSAQGIGAAEAALVSSPADVFGLVDVEAKAD